MIYETNRFKFFFKFILKQNCCCFTGDIFYLFTFTLRKTYIPTNLFGCYVDFLAFFVGLKITTKEIAFLANVILILE